MPTPPIDTFHVRNCLESAIIVAASQDGETVYKDAIAITILPGQGNVVSTWWPGVDKLMIGQLTPAGPVFNSAITTSFKASPAYINVVPGSSPGSYMASTTEKPVPCSLVPAGSQPVKPLWSPYSSSSSSSTTIPYMLWPAWAQALLWVGVALAGTGLAILVVYLIKRTSRRESILSEYMRSGPTTSSASMQPPPRMNLSMNRGDGLLGSGDF